VEQKDLKGKILAYTSAIMSDVKSDFSMARSVKVKNTPIGTKKSIIKKALKNDPSKITSLLKADSKQDLTDLLSKGNKAQAMVLEELGSMRKLLAVTASTGLESIDRTNFRDKIADKKEQRDDNKRIDKLIRILEEDSRGFGKEDDSDETLQQVIKNTTNNYYKGSGGMGTMMDAEGANDKPCPKGKKGKKCRAKRRRDAKKNRAKTKVKPTTKLKMPRVEGMVKGAGVAGALMMASDYVVGDRQVNAKNISEDSGMIAGSMAGASAGAMIGSVVPVVGTAIGGLVGGILGGIGGSKIGKSIYNYFSEEKKESLEEVTKKIINKSSASGSIVNYNVNNVLKGGKDYGSVAIDPRGRPIAKNNKKYTVPKTKKDFNPLDSDTYKFLNLDAIEGVSYTADDGLGREAYGGIDKIHQPKMFAKVSSGLISPHDANKTMLAKITKTLHKRMPDLKNRSQLAQEFAGILAMNTGAGSATGGRGGRPNGAVAFKPTYDLIDAGRFDEAIEHIKATRLTGNHKRHLIKALEQAKAESKATVSRSNINKESISKKIAIPDRVKNKEVKVDKLDQVAERLGEVVNKLDQVNKQAIIKTSKSKSKESAMNRIVIPDHIEPINDYALIALTNEE
jgi:uncharacterized protein YcfJ